MDALKTLCDFLQRTSTDGRIGPAHISLYSALLKCYYDQGGVTTVAITSNELMRLSKICSPTTYHRTIQQLNEFGYINYSRTYNRWETSTVKL